jgi:membrane dipeptidase
MRLSWRDLGTPRADRAHGKTVEIVGFPLRILRTATVDRFLMMAEPGCCGGCVPNNLLAVIEVIADQPLKLGNGKARLTGTLQVTADPEGWRYQLHDAELAPGLSRRAMLAASPLFCLPVPAMAQATDGAAVDAHSHAGNLIRASYGREGLLDVATPMRQGGLSVVCLCIVGDSPIISSKSGRIRPVREPSPGEL